MCVYVYVCVCVCVRMCVYVSMYVSVYVCMCLSMCVGMYNLSPWLFFGIETVSVMRDERAEGEEKAAHRTFSIVN